MQIELKTDLRAFTKGMAEVQKKQLPFAMASALTMTAGRVGLAWQDTMRADLDRPTPFTINSVAVRGARKSDLVATVYVKDIAAAYLEPFVEGGLHYLGQKKGILAPKAVPLNAYGNLPRSKLAALRGKPGVFVGPVRLKSGQVISGVWQRKGPAVKATGKRRERRSAQPPEGVRALTLLIRFSDPLPVKQRLPFNAVALDTVRRVFDAQFAKAFAGALATAK